MRKLVFITALVAGVSPAFAALDGFESKLTLNLNAVQSDTNTFNLRALVETGRRTDLTSISGRLRYAYSEQRVGGLNDVTTDNWLAFGILEQVIDSALDWYVSATLERDRINELDLRQIYTGGIVYKLRSEEDLRWKVRAGAGIIAENYRTSADTDDFTLEFGSDYYRKLSANLVTTHFFRFVPKPSDLGDYYLQSDLGLDYRLNDRMDASFRFILDYDKTPSTGFREDRIQWVLGIGYKF